MAPSIFGGGNSRETCSVKYFEIRLEESNLILRGTEDEASSIVLKGTLVLCLSEPMRIQGIRLRFTGERKLGWYQTGGTGSSTKQEEEFLRKTWDFKNKCSLPAGNYEYPFDLIIPGSTPESVEGLPDSYIIYRMKATIERNILAQNFVARKQVRLIRTLDTASLELAHAMSIENVWPEKIDYCLSTPTKAVIFGTSVQVDFRLVPLLKGLKIGKITTELNEKQDIKIRGTRNPSRNRQISRLIVKDEHRLPDDMETEDTEGQEGYVFSRSLRLPQSLKHCIQTVEALGIKVRHYLSFNIQMHNPDGHVSELHATLPLYIFISPNMPIDDNNNMISQGLHSVNPAAALDGLTPPQYGEHQFDQLYSDIDPNGYATPAGGVGTPLQSRSRSVSVENLTSLDGAASSDSVANVLQHRLSNLDMSGSNRVIRDRQLERSHLSTSGDGTAENDSTEIARLNDSSIRQNSLPTGGYFGHPGGDANQQSPQSAENIDPVSRRASEEEGIASGPVTPQHIEYSAESLSKVPSYTTALQSQARKPLNDGLPTYQTATRTPISASNQVHARVANRET